MLFSLKTPPAVRHSQLANSSAGRRSMWSALPVGKRIARVALRLRMMAQSRRISKGAES